MSIRYACILGNFYICVKFLITVQGFCLKENASQKLNIKPWSLTSSLDKLNLILLRLCHVIYYNDYKKYPSLGELGSINTFCLQMLLKILESGTMQIVFTMIFAYRTVDKYPNPLIFYRNTSFQQSDKQQIPKTKY